jgi:pimeloyl-ACP methyl ester carboxylesterase
MSTRRHGEADAVTLLLLPGLMCDRAVWAPTLRYVDGDTDCRVPDYGDARSLVAMAERVLAEAPPNFALAGHSMGGRVALEIVRRAPERVLRLALLDTGIRARPGGAAGEDEKAKRLALLAVARERGVRAMAHIWVQPMVHPDRLGDGALIDAVVDMFARRSADAFAGQIEALLARPDATEVLRTVTCQTLVLCGREDAWSTPAQHEEMAGMIAGAQLEVVAGCGHMAPMERPEAVGAALTAWLHSTPVAGASPSPALSAHT